MKGALAFVGTLTVAVVMAAAVAGYVYGYGHIRDSVLAVTDEVFGYTDSLTKADRQASGPAQISVAVRQPPLRFWYQDGEMLRYR
jgi:hypothetical protein